MQCLPAGGEHNLQSVLEPPVVARLPLRSELASVAAVGQWVKLIRFEQKVSAAGATQSKSHYVKSRGQMFPTAVGMDAGR